MFVITADQYFCLEVISIRVSDTYAVTFEGNLWVVLGLSLALLRRVVGQIHVLW